MKRWCEKQLWNLLKDTEKIYYWNIKSKMMWWKNAIEMRNRNTRNSKNTSQKAIENAVV